MLSHTDQHASTENHHEPGHDHHNHGHDHGGHHHHDHGLSLKLYFVGLALSVIALFLKNYPTIQAGLFIFAALIAGYHTIISEGLHETIENSREAGYFKPNSHILMGVAAIGAFCLQEFWDGALLILIFSGAHFLEDYASDRSQREISQLMKMNPTTARRIDDTGTATVVPVESLAIGDTVQVLAGDQIPIDGIVLKGMPTINQAAINGESIPVQKFEGDDVFAGTLNVDQSFVMQVTTESGQTLFAKIIDLVSQNQVNKTREATFIERLEPKYVTFVLAGVPLLILLGYFFLDWSGFEAIRRGLTVLVAASPCALAAATISATLSATSTLARNGVLSKGSTYLSLLSDIQAFAFDKTGTLTEGTPTVTDVYMIETNESQHLVNLLVALEKEANHPLATAILNHFDSTEQIELEVENIIGEGLAASHQGDRYRIGKPDYYQEVPQEIDSLALQWKQEGKTVVFFGKENQVLMAIALRDEPNPEARALIHYLHDCGLQTQMITGDNAQTAQAIAQEIGIDHVSAGVMPDEKADQILNMKEHFGSVAMVGDGINDAPALVSADVGIAMGQGTDIALEVADIALMNNNLSKIILTHQVASKMKRIIWQNIIFAMAVVVFLVTVSLLGLTNMAISVIVHEGSTLCVILNGLRLLREPEL